MDSRLRIGSAIGKSEEEIAPELMRQAQRYAPDGGPPALARGVQVTYF